MKRLLFALLPLAIVGLAHAAEPLGMRGFSLGQEASAKLLENKFEWIAFPDTLHKNESHCDDEYGICNGEFDLNEVTFSNITVTYKSGKIIQVMIEYPVEFARLVIDALTKRNGAPTKKWTEVSQNGFGATFTNLAASWDRKGQKLYTMRLDRNHALAILEYKTMQKAPEL